jgi:peptidyl-prolyl cis-trans isomerase C
MLLHDSADSMTDSFPKTPGASSVSEQANPVSGVRARFLRWLREPLLHFLLIGAAGFVLYGYVHRGESANTNYKIYLSLDDLKQLDISFISQWQRQPTPEEFTGLVEQFIRQEILYRQGLAMGLDKDDIIVKRRMAQKMEFLSEDVTSAHEPSTAELQTWYASHSQVFALPDRATFRHLYFSIDHHGADAKKDAEAALRRIAQMPEDIGAEKAHADQFMFQDYYADRAPYQLAKEFGPLFAPELFKLKTGEWQGPIESGYGWHLIWIESIAPGKVPAFEEVEPDVKTAWLADQKAIEWQKAYAAMRAKYEVIAPQSPPPTKAPPPAP